MNVCLFLWSVLVALNVIVGHVTQPGAPGNQTISLAANFDPKAIIMWGSAHTAAGSKVHAQHSIGWGTYRGAAVLQGGVATDARDAATSGNTCGSSFNDALAVLHTAAAPGSRDLEIDLVSMATGATSNVIINWVNLHTTASIQMNYMILGGSDIADAVVFSGTSSGGGAGSTQDVTVATGFGQPDFLFLAHGGGAHNSIVASGEQCFGFAKKGEPGRCMYYGSRDGDTTMFVTQSQRSDLIWRNFSASGGTGAAQGDSHVQTTLASWPTDGFQLVHDTANTASDFTGLALKGTFTSTTGAGTAPTSGGLPVTQNLDHGSVPSGMFLFGWNNAANTAVDTSSTVLGGFCVGAGDGTNERTAGLTDDDGIGTSVCDSMWSNTKVIRNYLINASLQSEADGAISGNNFQLSWNDIDTVARQYQWATFGAEAAAPSGRIMSSLVAAGGLAGPGGIAGLGGGLAG